MVLLLLPPIFAAMYWLLAYGGCDYHKVENGHVQRQAGCRPGVW